MHRSRVATVIIDFAEDSFERGAEFWSAALGRERLARSQRYESLRGRIGGEGGLCLGLQRGMDDPQKFHLDIGAARALERGDELIDSESGLSEKGTQCAFGEGAVLWNDKASVRRISVPQDHVAAALAVALVTELLERPNRLAGRDARQLAQTATSTNSSLIAGGMGSPRSLRLSR